MDWFLYDNGLRHERVKLCYKACIKGENKDSCPLNIKRPWFKKSLALMPLLIKK